MKESALFHFQRGDTVPLLLILDRRCDPFTPLLNQVFFYNSFDIFILNIVKEKLDPSYPFIYIFLEVVVYCLKVSVFLFFFHSGLIRRWFMNC